MYYHKSFIKLERDGNDSYGKQIIGIDDIVITKISVLNFFQKLKNFSVVLIKYVHYSSRVSFKTPN